MLDTDAYARAGGYVVVSVAVGLLCVAVATNLARGGRSRDDRRRLAGGRRRGRRRRGRAVPAPRAVARRRGHPLGTLAVNLSGTLVLGVLVGATLDGDAYRIAATGFLGAYTTFSAWMLESAVRWTGNRHARLGNIVGSFMAGLVAIAVGRSAGPVTS